jgi:hypothetical protein
MKAYRIYFKQNRSLLAAMKWMFKVGFVFTFSERIKTIEQVYKEYSDANRWHYIFVGHRKECRATMNTGPYSYSVDESYREIISITMSDFRKLVISGKY